MTRIVVQRGSPSNVNRTTVPSTTLDSQSHAPSPQITSSLKDEVATYNPHEHAVGDTLYDCGVGDNKLTKSDDFSAEDYAQMDETVDIAKFNDNNVTSEGGLVKGLGALRISDQPTIENEKSTDDSLHTSSSYPPPPPVPPPKPSVISSNNTRRFAPGSSNAIRNPSRRNMAWPVVSARTSPTGSCPSSPRSHGDSEGYNSADEQKPCFGSSFRDSEREHQFEIDIKRAKGLEVKRMAEDGNCLFRAVADQVYGDSEAYDLTRQMCIEFMERERDHYSQFITEGFTSYCKRKRRDKVYGNNIEIQAIFEMYNRPIHIYSYSTEPINIFHKDYSTDTPPIRLSYHHGNHYNSLVDPRRLTIGAGLGFGCLRGRNIGKEQIKAAIKTQQDQQIDNALLSEGRFYSDLELTEKEIERMVMETSRAEYVTGNRFKQQVRRHDSSTSGAEPSSSGSRILERDTEKLEGVRHQSLPDTVLSGNMQVVLSMGFTYIQVIEAYSIFGEDVDSIVCYLLETTSHRRKGKATE